MYKKLKLRARIFITLGTLLYLPWSKHTDNTRETAVLEGIATYYKDEEISTIKLINGTEDEIRKQSIPAEYEDMFKDFIKQLQIIDKQYDIYKNKRFGACHTVKH